MYIYGIKIDATKGIEVMKGRKALASYSGTPLGYACAKAHAKQVKSGYLRYWEAKAS